MSQHTVLSLSLCLVFPSDFLTEVCHCIDASINVTVCGPTVTADLCPPSPTPPFRQEIQVMWEQWITFPELCPFGGCLLQEGVLQPFCWDISHPDTTQPDVKEGEACFTDSFLFSELYRVSSSWISAL